jgi:hypothetical protein
MTTDRDARRIVRSWLRTDEHESADRVLDNVLALLDTTPQRRSWWPARRNAFMNPFAKLAMAAAALAVAAVVAVNLFSRSPQVGPPAATASRSLSPSPSPSVSASAPPIPAAGALEAGRRYPFTLGGVRFTMEVPSGDWVSNGDFGIDKSVGVGPSGAGFIFWTDDANGVFSDPCRSVKAKEAGPSAAELAAAIAHIPGTEVVSGPSKVTVGGRPAQFVAIRIPDDIACSPEEFYLWYDSSNDVARYATAKGSTIRVWIVEVDGARVQIDAETYKAASSRPDREIKAMINSIRFE